MRTSAAYTPGPGVTRWFLTSRKRSSKRQPLENKNEVTLPTANATGQPAHLPGRVAQRDAWRPIWWAEGPNLDRSGRGPGLDRDGQMWRMGAAPTQPCRLGWFRQVQLRAQPRYDDSPATSTRAAPAPDYPRRRVRAFLW